jgi:hypothetical protein
MKDAGSVESYSLTKFFLLIVKGPQSWPKLTQKSVSQSLELCSWRWVMLNLAS